MLPMVVWMTNRFPGMEGLSSNSFSWMILNPIVGNSLEGAVGPNDRILMSTKLSVGNLPSDITENDLRDMLSPHGPVNEIHVIMDKFTGRARGFAFVTMNTKEGLDAAI